MTTSQTPITSQSTETDHHQSRKDIQLSSILNIMARELDDFSQTWGSTPETVPQRFDDLFTLVKSAKSVSDNISSEVNATKPNIERHAITTKPDLDHIGKAATEALTYFGNGEHDSVRDMIIEIHREIYPNAWQTAKM